MCKKCKEITKLLTHHIYQITQVQIIQPLYKSQVKMLNNIKQMIESGFFYFSNHYDLTRQLINQNKPICEQYCWNHFLNQFLLKFNITTWFNKIIQGYIRSIYFNIDDLLLQFILISRRSSKKSGTRYNARGIDMNGYVANFVEIQIILVGDQKVATYTQIRGVQNYLISVPMYWQQNILGIYLEFKNSQSMNRIAFEKHLQLLKFKKIYWINLLSKNKIQQFQLTQKLQYLIKNYEKIHYFYYDFHKQCNLSFSQSNNFIEKIKPYILSNHFNLIDKGQVKKKQLSIFRTNCLDCLDRTNFIQSKISAVIIKQMFYQLGIKVTSQIYLQMDKVNEKCNNHIQQYKQLWADNGDAISILYTGVPSTHSEQVFITQYYSQWLKRFFWFFQTQIQINKKIFQSNLRHQETGMYQLHAWDKLKTIMFFKCQKIEKIIIFNHPQQHFLET